MNTLKDVQNALVAGYDNWKDHGEVFVKHKDDLSLFCYLPSASYKEEWTYLETIARGLILNNETGEVVARPFDKFFNWMQDETKYTNAPISHIQDKVDGSLIIVYFYNNEIRCATKGSFDSEQAQWAQDFIKRYDTNGIEATLKGGLTLLCEGIYPENRICVDYGDREELVLLGTRSNITGKLATFEDHLRCVERITGIPHVEFKNDLRNHDDIINHLETQSGIDNEGVVVHFQDGSLFKFKNPDYVRLHRMISNISFKNIKEAILDGSADELKAQIPDEFIDDFDSIYNDINDRWKQKYNEVVDIWGSRPETTTAENPRKELALWIKDNYPQYASYLFKMADDNFDRAFKMILEKEIEEVEYDEECGVFLKEEPK